MENLTLFVCLPLVLPLRSPVGVPFLPLFPPVFFPTAHLFQSDGIWSLVHSKATGKWCNSFPRHLHFSEDYVDSVLMNPRSWIPGTMATAWGRGEAGGERTWSGRLWKEGQEKWPGSQLQLSWPDFLEVCVNLAERGLPQVVSFLKRWIGVYKPIGIPHFRPTPKSSGQILDMLANSFL